MSLQIVPSGGPLGATIHGVDIRRPLDAADRAAILAAWHAHLVVVFAGQAGASLDDQIAFSQHFGEVELSPVAQRRKEGLPTAAAGDTGDGLDVPPEVVVVSNVVSDGRRIGALGDGEVKWHTDSPFYRVPPAASLLRAVEVPADGGGPTSFCNMYMAWETLPAELRRAVEGRQCSHSGNYDAAGKPYPGARIGDPSRSPGARHPIVRTHPDTGRRCLYLGRRLDGWIVGLPVDESEVLLDALWAHATQPEHAWTHRWRVGDAVLWDNRCAMHRRDHFDPAQRRLMYRTQIKGTPPL